MLHFLLLQKMSMSFNWNKEPFLIGIMTFLNSCKNIIILISNQNNASILPIFFEKFEKLILHKGTYKFKKFKYIFCIFNCTVFAFINLFCFTLLRTLLFVESNE